LRGNGSRGYVTISQCGHVRKKDEEAAACSKLPTCHWCGRAIRSYSSFPFLFLALRWISKKIKNILQEMF